MFKQVTISSKKNHSADDIASLLKKRRINKFSNQG